MIEITTSPHPVKQNQKDRLRRVKAFFSLVYRYGMIQSNWVMKMNTLEEAKAALFTIKQRNRFEPEPIFEAIKELWDEVPEVYIGCEGSPVMYILQPSWISQQPKNTHLVKQLSEEEMEAILHESDNGIEANAEIARRMGDRELTDEEREQLKEKIYLLFPSASELSVIEHFNVLAMSKGSIRIWWD